MAQPVIINGAMGSGRHYLVSLLREVFKEHQSVKIIDGFPATSDVFADDCIYSNHISFRLAPAHFLFDRFKDAVNTGRAHLVYLYRDPRDMLVSILRHHKYHTKKNDRYRVAHEEFKNDLNDQGSLVRLITRGRSVNFMDYHEFADDIRRFVSYPNTYLIRYEDLCSNPTVCLHNFLLHVGNPAEIKTIMAACAFVKRTGQPGAWRQYFDNAVEIAFKQHAGDLVSWLGYAPNESWNVMEVKNISSEQESMEEYISYCFRFFWQREPQPNEVKFLVDSLDGMSKVDIRDWCIRESGVGIVT